MIVKWFIYITIIYLLYRLLNPILSIYKINKTINNKNRKKTIHDKVSKMDIQDAEFEEKID